MSGPAVLVEDLRLAYGTTWALDGIDVEAEAGRTLAVLGHNGAGKTSLLRVLTTLVRPTAGRVLVDGLDLVTDPVSVRRRIGVTGQYAGLDEFLTARENLELVGRLTGLRTRTRRRVTELIEHLNLADLADRRVSELSGGSRRRVDLAASLVDSPSVLFLDEPTTGLDPLARAGLWTVIDGLIANGTTIVLTTQYLEEADRLADHVVVLDHGRVAVRGTPTELKAMVGGKTVAATIPRGELHALPTRPHTEHPVDEDHVRVSLTVDDSSAAGRLVALLDRDLIAVIDLEVTSPSLDDVVAHLAHTGVLT